MNIEIRRNNIIIDEDTKKKKNLNPNRKYYINKKGEICRLKQPHLLGLFNKKIRYAYAYCRLKNIYLNKRDVSSKKCLQKGKDYCKHLYLLEGNERINGIKYAKQRKWEE